MRFSFVSKIGRNFLIATFLRLQTRSQSYDF
jgi:hypothetical protein